MTGRQGPYNWGHHPMRRQPVRLVVSGSTFERHSGHITIAVSGFQEYSRMQAVLDPQSASVRCEQLVFPGLAHGSGERYGPFVWAFGPCASLTRPDGRKLPVSRLYPPMIDISKPGRRYWMRKGPTASLHRRIANHFARLPAAEWLAASGTDRLRHGILHTG